MTGGPPGRPFFFAAGPVPGFLPEAAAYFWSTRGPVRIGV